MPTINLPEIPKFLDESLTPAAQEIGQTLSNIFYLIFNPINYPIEKLRIKQAANLKKYAHDIQAELNNIPLENNSKVKTLIPIIESLGKRAKIIRGTFTRTN